MPGGLTLLASADADIPTPASGKVTIFFSTDSGVPSYKDDTGTVSPLGTTGATGATGPAGPPVLFIEDMLQGEMGFPGPTGATGAAGSTSGTLIGVQIIDTPGAFTYTPTPGTNSVIMELLGAGGGGCGVAQPGASNIALGRSGAGGAWLLKRLTSGFSGESGSIGAGGTGGAAGTNAGTAGGDTTFTDGSATTYTAAGGPGGPSAAATTTTSQTQVGVGGGAATNGDLQRNGERASFSIVITATNMRVGAGGNSKYGTGGVGAVLTANNTSQAGSNASGHGAGGGGAGASGTGAAVAGGNGSDGMAIFWEYA